MNKKLAFLVILLIASPTFAADQASSSLPKWGGFYAGGNLGYAKTNSSFTHLEGAATSGERFSNNPSGVLGGAQVGMRFNVDKDVYLGIEAAYTSRNKSNQTLTNLNNIPRYRLSDVGNILSISGSVGHSFGSYLAYAKAGYARSEIGYKNILVSTNAILGQSTTKVGGGVIGAGIEYSMTQNISLGLEYNYYKFNVGNQVQLTTAGVAAGATNSDNDLTSHAVSARVNYRF